MHSLEAFLGGMGVRQLLLKRIGITPQAFVGSGFAWPPPYTLAPGQPTPGSAYPSASPHRWPNAGRFGRPRRAFLSRPGSAVARTWWYWNINQSSIDYAFRPRLRSRLTLGGRTFPRKPWVYGESEFNRLYRYSCLHPLFRPLQFQSPSTFAAAGMLPYPSSRPRAEEGHRFGTAFDRQSFSARHRSMSQLLRTV